MRILKWRDYKKEKTKANIEGRIFEESHGNLKQKNYFGKFRKEKLKFSFRLVSYRAHVGFSSAGPHTW